jgi:hypothetical protein
MEVLLLLLKAVRRNYFSVMAKQGFNNSRLMGASASAERLLTVAAGMKSPLAFCGRAHAACYIIIIHKVCACY